MKYLTQVEFSEIVLERLKLIETDLLKKHLDIEQTKSLYLDGEGSLLSTLYRELSDLQNQLQAVEKYAGIESEPIQGETLQETLPDE